MSVADFQGYWRYRHGTLAAQAPQLRRYVQSHALLQGYKKGELLFDGLDEMWFDAELEHKAFLRSSLYRDLEADRATFLDRTRTVTMPVDVIVAKDGVIPENAVKNVEFVNRRPGMALEPFRKYWREVHGPIASKISAIRRYEQNHLVLSCYEKNASPPYDGLAITWFESTAEMKHAATTPEYAATRADEPNFLPDGHLPIIITKEHVLVG
jgi:uncharacterized protein (TIGR02118 family)